MITHLPRGVCSVVAQEHSCLSRRLETIQCFVIHYVCKSNENKPLKYLLSGPLGESVLDVRLNYA